MEIQGKIVIDLGEQSGTSRAGNSWRKHEYVLETHETYPKKVCFNLFGDRCDQYACAIGEEVTVSFDISSREYNGRWYTDISAWKIDKGTAEAPVPPVGNPVGTFNPTAAAPAAAPAAPAPASDPFSTVPNDDLPF